MKTTISFLFWGSLLSFSCQNETTENTSVTTESTINLPVAGAAPNTQSGALIGKRIAEIKQMGRYNCMGIGLEEVAGGAMWYSVQWAPEMGSCYKGKNIITLEKILSGDGSFTEDRMVEAELPIYPIDGELSYTTVPLSLNGGAKTFYVVEYKGRSTARRISNVQRLWALNTTTKSFDETPVPAGLAFVNPYIPESQ